jgi:hypothetical protein
MPRLMPAQTTPELSKKSSVLAAVQSGLTVSMPWSVHSHRGCLGGRAHPRQLFFFGDLSDRRDRDKQTRRTRSNVNYGSTDRLMNESAGQPALKKDIRSRIYEEYQAFPICDLPNDGNTSRLPSCRVKSASRDDLIFEVDSNYARVHQTREFEANFLLSLL